MARQEPGTARAGDTATPARKMSLRRITLLALRNGGIAALSCAAIVLVLFGAAGGGSDPYGVVPRLTALAAAIAGIAVAGGSWLALYLWFIAMPRSSNGAGKALDE